MLKYESRKSRQRHEQRDKEQTLVASHSSGTHEAIEDCTALTALRSTAPNPGPQGFGLRCNDATQVRRGTCTASAEVDESSRRQTRIRGWGACHSHDSRRCLHSHARLQASTHLPAHSECMHEVETGKERREEQRRERRQQEAQRAPLKLSHILTQVSRDLGCSRCRARG